MASISQGIVLTTAMLLSSTVLYLAFSTHKPSPSPPFQIPRNPNSHNPNNTQILRSCLYSDDKKRERNKKNKKKKRVKFSESVMVKEVKIENYDEENREERRKQNRASSSKNCRRNGTGEIRGMPANRMALYNGMLRDRGHRMAFCH